MNLPKKLKKGLKHCNTLTKKKLEIFKDALKKKANRIFFYEGIYKAIEQGASDNGLYAVWPGAVAKSQLSNDVYGGALGGGNYPPSFTDDQDIDFSFAAKNMNVLAICLDMPTGDFLPSSFEGDFYNTTTGNRRRQFGLVNETKFNTKVVTVLNEFERNIKNFPVPVTDVIPISTVGGLIDYQKVYTLSYDYSFHFVNNAACKMKCFVITFKLKNATFTDFPQGLSNWLNEYITEARTRAVDLMDKGEMPPCFQVLKKRSIILEGAWSQNVGLSISGKSRMGTIRFKSPSAYIASATRPSTKIVDEVSQPNSNWYAEHLNKYTYCLVYAVPVSSMVKNVDSGAYNSNPGRVQCKVFKRTSYCTLVQ